MTGPWHELDADLSTELRDLLVGHQTPFRALINAGQMLGRFRMRPLPFWTDWMWIDALIEPRDSAGELASAAFLYGPYGAMPLDGASSVIHEVNDSGILDVGTGELACEYLRLFCSAVHGDLGPFHLIESPAAFVALTGAGEIPPEVATHAQPARASLIDGGWRMDAVVFYFDCLFAARFKLSTDGAVEMTGDDPLAAGLPQAAFAWDGFVCRPVAAGVPE